MSETIGEMILPGTYINVRAEGLIGVGGISTGNVGVVGTAARGTKNKVELLGSYSQAVDLFGAYDRWNPDPAASPKPLTLTRTLEQAFRGGASTVYAVRIANGTPASSAWGLKEAGADGVDLFTISANSPGTWANDFKLNVVTEEPRRLEIVAGKTKESFDAPNAGALFDALRSGSQLVVVDEIAAANRARTVKGGAVVQTRIGTDGASAGGTEVAEGLARLAGENVNIIIVGGLPASNIADEVLAHLETTENDGSERMAVVGASSDTPSEIIANDVSKGSSPRLILTAPGIEADDAARAGDEDRTVELPAAYAAALVAGKLSTLAPHVSLTNKGLPASGLTRLYNRSEQKLLLQNQLLVLHRNLGFRVLKGITTDTGAFRQISVRRIVDYAKAGVRQGANPYIGKLNNARVRAALKATLDAFLSGMVLDEMLTGYTLDVTATRRQEIEGVALVTMNLQPTFSIDFVKVIMNLS